MSQETESVVQETVDVAVEVKLVKLKNGEQFVASIGEIEGEDSFAVFNPLVLNLVPMDQAGQQMGVQTRPWLMFNKQDEPVEIDACQILCITNVDPQVLQLFKENEEKAKQEARAAESGIVTPPEKELVIP